MAEKPGRQNAAEIRFKCEKAWEDFGLIMCHTTGLQCPVANRIPTMGCPLKKTLKETEEGT